MGYKLCTAEKPSVAEDIARVIGATKKEKGFYIGNGFIVTWAVGHLVGLAEPEEYGYVPQKEMYVDDELKKAAYEELPLIPREFKLVVLEKTKEQFDIVKKLMHREDVDEIIDCGDMGAEGHILQWFIREKANNTKPVRRFCATSMTEEAIKEAMGNLKGIEQFLPIIKGEYCKKKEDWILGMSLSRALSIKYRAGINVGRVQSPTLGFVVKRYLEVINFKPINYYTMDAIVGVGDSLFHVFWNKDSDETFPQNIKTNDNRILNEQILIPICKEIKENNSGIISELITVKKATDRPQLYDITELQRDANRKYGYTAAVTLATAQALYETQKVLSYPRTDSRYITHDLVPYMLERVKMMSTLSKYKEVAEHITLKGLNIDKKIVDDSKVTDHHAIIVTERIKDFDISNLNPTDDERKKGVTVDTLNNILDLVLSRMLISFSSSYKYEQTILTITFENGFKFSSSGNKPIDYGWKEVEKKLCREIVNDELQIENEEQIFPNVEKMQSIFVKDCLVIPKKTTSPKLHTEATLLTAMENAGQHIENGEILKGKGIGTQATRAEIIKKLFDTGVVETENKGKIPYIKPTKKGLNIIQILPPDLYSPKITADWETRISEIASNKKTEDDVMNEFEKYIKEKTEQIKTMPEKVSFAREKEIFGFCPWCGEPVYRFQEKTDKGKITDTRFYCSAQCNWSLRLSDVVFATRLGRNLSQKEATKMIAKGFIVLECTTKINGSKYRGEFTFSSRVNNGKTYCNVKCEPVKTITQNKRT